MTRLPYGARQGGEPELEAGGQSLSRRSELRRHWLALFGACLGAGAGAGLSVYTSGVFGPALLAEFGWTPSQFALIGTLALAIIVILPIAGRLSDSIGVRVVAGVGFTGLAAVFFVMSLMSGSFSMFAVITVAQYVFGAFTTSAIFSRVVAERFIAARGLGFAIVMSGPPLMGAIVAPVLGWVIEHYDWRAAYQVLTAICALSGVLVVWALPMSKDRRHKHAASEMRPATSAKVVFRDVVRQKAFWLIVAGMFLINVPQGLAGAQLKLMAVDSGATAQLATWMMSFYALGVLSGRVLFGVSLDRFPCHLVAAIGLSLPAFGFFALASNFDHGWFLISAILLIGLAQGAEGDVAAYLVSRHFKMANFSFVLSLLGSLIAVSSAVGAVILSGSLEAWGGYRIFILLSAWLTLMGALVFAFIGNRPDRLRHVDGQPVHHQQAQVGA